MRHILIFLTFTMLSGASAVAQQMDHSHMQGMNHGAMMGMPGIPTEPGQSAFAAIQEIAGHSPRALNRSRVCTPSSATLFGCSHGEPQYQ